MFCFLFLFPLSYVSLRNLCSSTHRRNHFCFRDSLLRSSRYYLRKTGLAKIIVVLYRDSLFIIHYSLFIIHYSLFIIHYYGIHFHLAPVEGLFFKPKYRANILCICFNFIAVLFLFLSSPWGSVYRFCIVQRARRGSLQLVFIPSMIKCY